MKKIALIISINAAIIAGLFITAELVFRDLLFSKFPFMEVFENRGSTLTGIQAITLGNCTICLVTGQGQNILTRFWAG